MFHRAPLAALLIALSAVQAWAADAEKIRVACVGDSITYGAAIKNRAENNYPRQLGKLLGDKYEVRNFGVNGATLLKKGDKPYWKLTALKRATMFKPHVVIIKLGTNDTKPRNWKHKARFADDLRAMIDHFTALPSRPKIFLSTAAPVVRDRWGINEKTVKGELIPLIAKVAAKEKLTVIDFYAALAGKPEFFPDGVHPNAKGAALMAAAAKKAIAVK